MDELSRAEWLERFQQALRHHLPSLSAGAASAYAAQTFEEASDLAPAEAAAIFAVEMPPAEVGAPE